MGCVITLTQLLFQLALLDSRRHCSGPLDFSEAEASEWVALYAMRAVREADHRMRAYAIAWEGLNTFICISSTSSG